MMTDQEILTLIDLLQRERDARAESAAGQPAGASRASNPRISPSDWAAAATAVGAVLLEIYRMDAAREEHQQRIALEAEARSEHKRRCRREEKVMLRAMDEKERRERESILLSIMANAQARNDQMFAALADVAKRLGPASPAWPPTPPAQQWVPPSTTP